MSKRNILLFLFLVLIIGLVIFKVITKPILQKEEILKEKFIPSERGRVGSISGGKDFPDFVKEVIIDPYEARKGETQTFSIWAKDPQEIEKVIVTIKTDAGDEVIDLKLVEGTDEEGRWQDSWVTRDISVRSFYSVVFQATNKKGKETKMPLSLYFQAE